MKSANNSNIRIFESQSDGRAAVLHFGCVILDQLNNERFEVRVSKSCFDFEGIFVKTCNLLTW